MNNLGNRFFFLTDLWVSEVAQLCPTLCDPMDTRLLRPWDFLGKSNWIGLLFPSPGNFPTQGLNPGLPHCRQTLYRLSHQGRLTDLWYDIIHKGFSGGASGKEPAYQCWLDERDKGSVPGWGRSPGGGHSNLLQYSCLENPMDRRVWRATVHRISESDWTETS